VQSAADALFSKAELPGGGAAARALVIDPLVDGVTGVQSNATQSMGAIIAEVARGKYQQRFALQEFSADTVGSAPLVLVGTFTGLNKEGKPIGQREVYRICLALADLSTGKIVGKGPRARYRTRAVLHPCRWPTSATARPGAWTRASTATSRPARAPRRATRSTRPTSTASWRRPRRRGDRRLQRRPLPGGAGPLPERPGDAGRRPAPGPQRPLPRELEARPPGRGGAGLRRIVDHGLARNRLVVKLLFKQASTAFWPDPAVSEQYPMWLGQIAQGAVRRGSCLEVTGHTSPTGPAALNERLSLLRAEYVKSRLEAEAPPLAGRVIANGVGSRETIVGTGRDDATDALDRRVEFKPLAC
jgi:hypothetical protein